MAARTRSVSPAVLAGSPDQAKGPLDHWTNVGPIWAQSEHQHFLVVSLALSAQGREPDRAVRPVRGGFRSRQVQHRNRTADGLPGWRFGAEHGYELLDHDGVPLAAGGFAAERR